MQEAEQRKEAVLLGLAAAGWRCSDAKDQGETIIFGRMAVVWATGMRSGWMFFYFFLFIFGCPGSSLLTAWASSRFPVVAASGGHSFCCVWASHCGGFSCCEVQAQGVWAQ